MSQIYLKKANKDSNFMNNKLIEKIKAIVFDLDGTLINLGDHVRWQEAHKKAIESYLKSGCDEEKVMNCSAKGLFYLLDEMWESFKDNESRDAYNIQKKTYDEIGRFELEGAKSCSLMPGCTNTLQWLKEQELLLGICTSNSKDAAIRALKIQNILKYFHSIVGRDPKYRMKPNPDQLLACFQEIRVNPSEGVMVGDSHIDILAGKNAGSFTIAIPVYFTQKDKLKDANPDIIINNLTELPSALQILGNKN
jgi:pyrophosphatase PpaX